uniref:Carboxylesterase type B domain-containing protein n=1 Tax=Kwoniella dejecticola CBS 10117 TaxID=1296121 RepID=A0A1A5ZWA5_9TREE|nr:uncharacterized protein I303_08000 [Kwoniella dejecticola CBS 10117]OBR82086.1 hypothetical protein I303_08000 [Kwoniella dejecticola CBS 10117]
MGNVLSPKYTYEECTADLGELGQLRGTLIDGRVKRYVNVPFALPPTGENRFKRPRPLPKGYSYSQDGQPRNAVDFGLPCPQPTYTSLPVSELAEDDGSAKEYPYDEDCLKMNIWMPSAPPPPEGYSVYAYMHGGWLQIGDPSIDPKMDPTELITTGGLNCIFISLGYRVSALGFLACKELQEESPDGSVGNYGLWDQRVALEWIHNHIGALGGNPKRVVVGGRSAGAYSTHAQLVHELLQAKPTEGGLFQRAILLSNAIPCLPKTVEETQSQFESLLTALDIPLTLSGPERLKALRAVPAEALTRKIMTIDQFTFRTVQDGVFFPKSHTWLYDGKLAEEFKKRNMAAIIGEVQDEVINRILSVTGCDLTNLSALATVVNQMIDLYLHQKIKEPYQHPDPNPDIDSYTKVLGDIISDGQVRAPSRSFARQLRDAGVPLDSVHRYIVAWVPEFVTKFAPPKFGVTHAMDRPIHNFSIFHGPKPHEEELMREWIKDYANFINWKPVNFGVDKWTQVKVLSPKDNGSIRIEDDTKWDYLEKVSEVIEGRPKA